MGDWKVLEVLLIHVGFGLAILKPCSCLMKAISLSLISGVGGEKKLGKASEKTIYSIKLYSQLLFSYGFLDWQFPFLSPLIFFFSGLEDFSRVNSHFSFNLCKAYYTNEVQGPAA